MNYQIFGIWRKKTNDWRFFHEVSKALRILLIIIGAGIMGSALAFPARENGHEVRLVGTHRAHSFYF